MNINKDYSLNEKEHDFYNEISRLNNELVTSQREITKKNVELEKLNNEKNQFLGMAAHELRNPLNVVASFSQFLLEDTREILDDEQLNLLRLIQSSGKHMLDIISNLLDISVIEAGKLELNFEMVDLVSFVQNIIKISQIIAAPKNIQIVFDYSETPEAYIDASKFQQVITNLISNAIKFSHINSKINISLSVSEKEILIIVEDEGQGIPSNELDKLFKPFGKTNTRGTMGEKSTGLGLAIVQKIVESHKGKITVESELGAGAKFTVALPNNQ